MRAEPVARAPLRLGDCLDTQDSSGPRARLLALCVCWLSLLSCPAWSAAIAQAQGNGAKVRIDGIAAVAGAFAPDPNAVVVLRSDVDLRARLSLLAAGVDDVADAPVPVGLLRATLTELVGEALIVAEAQRLDLAAPTSERVQRERRRLLANVGGATRLGPLLDALGVSEREVNRLVLRRATVGAFLDANLEGISDITEAELARAYETEDHPFRDRPLPDAREPLRGWLSQRRLESAVSRWVEALRQRTAYRVLATY